MQDLSVQTDKQKSGESPAVAAKEDPRALVSRLREILREAPGNPELNEAWDWSSASLDAKGRFTVPGREGYPELKLVSLEQHRTAGGGAGAYASTNSILFPVSTKSGELLPPEAVEKLEALGVRFSRPVTPDVEKIYEESKMIHEVTHVRGASGQPGTEFNAYTAQYRYLAAQGVVEMPSQSTILKHIQDYHPRIYGTELMQAFGGQLTNDALNALPGGKDFRTEVIAQRGSNPQDVWNSKYGRELLEGIQDYYRNDYLLRARREGPSQDPATDVEKAIEHAEKMAEEAKKRILAFQARKVLTTG